jgi:transcription antitermination factor NusG
LSGAGYGNSLYRRCDADHVLQDPGALKVGNEARISENPLSGFVAEIITIKPDSRVHLMLYIMEQATHITVAP